MKFFILFILLGSSLGCSKEPHSVASQEAFSNSAGFSIESLQSTRVREFFIIIFSKDYSPEEWKVIFELTEELSLNRKKLREIEGSLAPETELVRAELLGKNSNLLTDLGTRSIFILNWSLSDENCRIRSNNHNQTLLQCKPRNLDNPLNGGLPSSVDPLSIIDPNPVVSDIKTPFLRILLVLPNSETNQGYSIEVRLRPESITEQTQQFKGEAIPKSNSYFRKNDGTWTRDFFPYGYAELTLSR